MFGRFALQAAATFFGGTVLIGPVILALVLAPDRRGDDSSMLAVGSLSEAVDVFKRQGLDPEVPLTGDAADLPRVFLEALPGDLQAQKDVSRRKAMFVSVVLPHVLRANDRLLADRARLIALRDTLGEGRRLRDRDRRWLRGIAAAYGRTMFDFEGLLRRVDAIPPRLAVAQAAQESGWGTSRFALTGNALFGQHAPIGGGAMPARGRDNVALKAFGTLYASVESYMRNLNTHRAYRGFRVLRARQRRDEAAADPFALAGTLERYSEEREVYVRRLHTLMRMPEIAAVRAVRLQATP